MNPNLPSLDLPAVVRAFPLLGQYRSAAPYGSGHINDTFVVVFDQAGTPVRYLVQRVNDLEKTYKAKSDAELKAVTGELKQKLDNGATLDDLLPDAFAACREASIRTTGARERARPATRLTTARVTSALYMIVHVAPSTTMNPAPAFK